MRANWFRLAAAVMIVAAAAFAFCQNAHPNLDSSQVIQFLNQTIDWYRRATPVQQTATEPEDFMLVSDNARMANQIVRLAFDFGRAEAEDIGRQGNANGNPEQGQKPSGGSSALLQLESKLDQQTQGDESEAALLQQKLETATGSKRQQLESQLAATQAALDLVKARRDQVHSMGEFLNQASSSDRGATGLQAQVQALADAVPAASAASSNGDVASAKDQLSPAVLAAAANKPAPSGIWESTADLVTLSQEINMVDAAAGQTEALARKVKEIRTPLVSRLKALSAQGDELGKEADSANETVLAQEKQQLEGLAGQYKQLSAAVIPLAKQAILLDLYQRNLSNLESTLRNRRMAELKGLVVRLTFLALVIGIVVTAAALWGRAVHRYVHEPRRRYQLLLLRRFVLWFLITVIVAFAFASRLGSVVTFAGLITAGVAVALQSVILSIVGYFFLIGKFGIRVGDRVEMGGVKGEVIDIGLVRMHLMELGGADYVPTGRVVAFSNSIVFQPTVGLFKQVPGTNFLWHEITLALSPDTDYSSVKERLLKVVEAVLADYRDDLERQYRALQTNLFSTPASGFRPKAQLRFTPSAVEVVISFLVDRQLASEIDERVTRELMKNLDREPKLKLVSSASPSIAVKTDLAA